MSNCHASESLPDGAKSFALRADANTQVAPIHRTPWSGHRRQGRRTPSFPAFQILQQATWGPVEHRNTAAVPYDFCLHEIDPISAPDGSAKLKPE
jgi:hypothetical protein